MPTRRTFLFTLGTLAVAGLPGCQAWSDALGLTRGSDPAPGDGLDLAAHVLARCTAGARPGDRGELLARDPDPEGAVERWLDDQLAGAGRVDRPVARLVDDLDTIHAAAGELYEYTRPVIRDELAWACLVRQACSRDQLAEQLAGVWRDHLHVGPKGDAALLVAAYEREVIRPHVLGSFPAMLRASLVHPAMLHYLDGRDNRREHPNENHARELLELHTMGVGSGYTQQDVMEVARCLTGWVVRPSTGFRKASVFFDPERHDPGAKTVLGQEIPAGGGAGDLDRVLAVICRQRATAERLAGKVARRFIADDPPAAAVAAGADAFAASDGDLRAMVRAVLTAPAFRDPAVRGTRLRRPNAWLAGCLRHLAPTSLLANPPRRLLLAAATRLGDLPWQHLTPDGPPEAARHWTGTLWWRWRAASDLAAAMPQALDPAVAWGRQPTGDERRILAAAGPRERTALILASPGFLRC